jgi:hypothetical protein
MLTENLLQGHTELYRSYPPQPDIPQPDHLLPSAAAEAKRARIAQALHSSESTEDRSPLAEKETEGEARRDNSPGPAVELTEALPLKRPPTREDLKVLIYQSQEADNTFITTDGTSPYNSSR